MKNPVHDVKHLFGLWAYKRSDARAIRGGDGVDSEKSELRLVRKGRDLRKTWDKDASTFDLSDKYWDGDIEQWVPLGPKDRTYEFSSQGGGILDRFGTGFRICRTKK